MKTWAKLEGEFITAIAEAVRAPLGEWVEIPVGVWTGWQARPSPTHRPAWRGGLVVWLDPRPIEMARAARVAAMRDARDAVLNSTFTWDGSTFDADQVSQTRLLGAVVAALEPGFDPTLWRLADNSWRELTGTQLRAVYQALQQHVRASFTQFGQREAAINNAATVAAVDAVTWE